MYPGMIRRGFDLSKVLGHINKTLNFASQVIPIYVKAKPVISNAKQAYSVARKIVSSPKKEKVIEVKAKEIPKKDSPSLPSSNRPVFFL